MLDDPKLRESHDEVIARLGERLEDGLGPLLDGGAFALVDYPDHPNVGDSAIWLGETAFFRARGSSPAYVSTIGSHDHDALEAAVPDGTIFLHGGGNFGTLWPSHQRFRLALMERFPERRIVQLPQSIHFAEPEAIDACARAIERHGRFTLCVRDWPSFDFAGRHFPCETLLVPDMAFALGPLARRSPSVDIFYLMRTDVERAGSGERLDPLPEERIADWLEDDRAAMRLAALGSRLLTVMDPPDRARVTVYERRAQARLRRGIDQLSSGRVVVTDRLHGHILSTLLGIPHVALDNVYRKIGNFIDAWTGELEGLRVASEVEEARRAARSLLGAALKEPA